MWEIIHRRGKRFKTIPPKSRSPISPLTSILYFFVFVPDFSQHFCDSDASNENQKVKKNVEGNIRAGSAGCVKIGSSA